MIAAVALLNLSVAVPVTLTVSGLVSVQQTPSPALPIARPLVPERASRSRLPTPSPSAVHPRTVTPGTRTPRTLGTPAARSGEALAVLRRIAKCESDGNPRARNRRSSASGLYQFLTSTWRVWRGDEGAGYPTAADAPEGVQTAAALRLYRAEGTRPWASSRGCWG